MNLKTQLDEYRAGAPSRFTEQQRKVMGRFHQNVAAAQRKTPKTGDILPPFALRGPAGIVTPEGLLDQWDRLALVFLRGAW